DPASNTWTPIANFPRTHFGDDPSMVLDNGQVLCGDLAGPQTYLYDPATNIWTQAATKLNNDRSDEESWVKLADGSILSVDIFNSLNNGQNTAQRYIPSLNQWVATGNLPVTLSSASLGYELGPASLLSDGRAFYLGANGHTALYNASTDSW